MIEENDKLISQVEYIIERKEEIIDKGRLIKVTRVHILLYRKMLIMRMQKKLRLIWNPLNAI